MTKDGGALGRSGKKKGGKVWSTLSAWVWTVTPISGERCPLVVRNRTTSPTDP